MTGRGRAVIAWIAVVVAGVLVPPTPIAAGGDGSPRGRLREAATGTWAGTFGTVEFRADGTAAFTLLECGFTPLERGFVQTYTDCPPEATTGAVTVHRDGYSLADAAGTRRFQAYVDDGTLHLGHGVVARLDRDREGRVVLGPGERLRVGDGECRYTSTTRRPVERPCRYTERDDRTLLLFTAPDPFAGGTIGTVALVYLAGPRLLVSPELVERAYARAAA